MSMLDQNAREPESPGALLSEILKDALDEDEQLWAFRQWFDEKLRYPLHGFVLGEPVLVQEIGYDVNRRRGLTAACQKLNDECYVINLSNIEFPKDSDAGQYLAAYRRWQGPDYRRNPRDLRNALRQGRTIKGEGLVTLAVLAVREQSVRCRFKDKLREVTCHLSNFTRFVPGESVTVQVRKMWHQSSLLQLSGFLLESRIDMATIDLPSQRLVERGTWDPAEHDWANQEEPPSKDKNQLPNPLAASPTLSPSRQGPHVQFQQVSATLCLKKCVWQTIWIGSGLWKICWRCCGRRQ